MGDSRKIFVLHRATKSTGLEVSKRPVSIRVCSCSREIGGYSLLKLKNKTQRLALQEFE
jgi:hypothetical protein